MSDAAAAEKTGEADKVSQDATPAKEGGGEPDKGAKPLTEAGPGNEPPAKPQTWPDEWRELALGDDRSDKDLNQLKRLKSPAELTKAYLEAQKTIRKGLEPLTLSEESSEEDIAAYRKGIGIPEKIEDYKLEFSEKMQPTDADKEALDAFRKMAFENHMPPVQAQAALDWYETSQELQLQDIQETALEFRNETSETLRQEWGGEYQSNINAIKTFMEGRLGEGYTDLAHKQFADGTFLGDDPNFLKMMVGPATDHVGPNAIFSGDIQAKSADLEKRKDEILQMKVSKDRHERAKYHSDQVQGELTGIYDKLAKMHERMT